MRRVGTWLLLLLAIPARADFFVGKGGTGAAFLKIPMAARQAAMAGAYSSGFGDSGSLEYNPAGLVGTNRTDLNLTYISYLENTSLQSASVAFPLALGKPGAKSTERAFGRSNQIFVGGHYRLFRADDEGRDVVGAKTGSFQLRDQMAQLAAAYALTQRMAFGVSGKYIGRSIASDSADTFAADVGALYKINDRMNAGVSLLNMGPSKAFIDQSDPLPFTARGGASYQLNKILLLADLAVSRDSVVRESLGGEYQLNRNVAFRLGTYYDSNIQFTGGLGIQFAGPSKRLPEAPTHYPPSSTQEQAAAAPVPVPVDAATSQKESAALMEKMSKLASTLAEQYKTVVSNQESPLFLVYPLSSDVENLGSMVSDVLTEQLEHVKGVRVVDPADVAKAQNSASPTATESERALAIARALNAQGVVTGNVIRVNGNHFMTNARVLEVQSGRVVSTGYENFDWSAGSKGVAVAPMPVSHATSSIPSELENPNIDIGIDYAIRTASDLGVSHTVSLRILY
jgi:hypothetical protein